MNRSTLTAAAGLTVLVAGLILWQLWLSPSPASSGSGNNRNENSSVSLLNQNQNAVLVVPTQVNQNSTPTAVQPQLTEKILADAGLSNTRLEEVKQGKDLFGLRLEELAGEITKWYIYQEDFPVGTAYAFTPDLTYADLKRLVAEKVANSPVYSVNETNSFGQHSFYLNNNNRGSTAFILIEFKRAVLGFEFPKEKKPLFDLLLSNLQLTF